MQVKWSLAFIYMYDLLLLVVWELYACNWATIFWISDFFGLRQSMNRKQKSSFERVLPLPLQLPLYLLLSLPLLLTLHLLPQAALPGAIASESIPALDESGARLMSDMTLVSSVSINGWQAAAPICLNRTNERLLDPQGKPVDEVGARPAAILLEYGLSHAIVRAFNKGQRSCELSFLRFKTKQGAFGAYSTMREGSSTVVARGQASSETENSISFYSADCLVLLKCAEDDSEAKAALSQLADKFAPRLPESVSSPAILTHLPRYSRLQGSEKLFMGNKSASHYSSFPFIDSLRLDRCTEAVTADYSYARPLRERLHLLLADYGKPETASQCYDAYVQEMTPYLRKTVENAQGEFLGKLNDSYLMCGLRGTRVFVIAGARKSTAPRMLSRELRH